MTPFGGFVVYWALWRGSFKLCALQTPANTSLGQNGFRRRKKETFINNDLVLIRFLKAIFSWFSATRSKGMNPFFFHQWK